MAGAVSARKLDPLGGWSVRYVTSDTWRQLRRFNDEVQGVPLRHQQRRLVLLAAYCGSPASQTAAAIRAPVTLVVDVGRGRASLIEPRSMERLHDWINASLWRHLWRAGSEPAQSAAAIVEARNYAASVAEVADEWIRDWRIAAGEVMR